jgi:hypothetical protein
LNGQIRYGWGRIKMLIVSSLGKAKDNGSSFRKKAICQKAIAERKMIMFEKIRQLAAGVRAFVKDYLVGLSSPIYFDEIDTPAPPPGRVCRYCKGGRKRLHWLRDNRQPVILKESYVLCSSEECPDSVKNLECPYCQGSGIDDESPLAQNFVIGRLSTSVEARSEEEAIRVFAESVRRLPAWHAKRISWIHGVEARDCPMPPYPYWRIIEMRSLPISHEEASYPVYLAVPDEVASLPVIIELTHDRWVRHWEELAKAPADSLLFDEPTKTWIAVPVFLRTNGLLSEVGV